MAENPFLPESSSANPFVDGQAANPFLGTPPQPHGSAGAASRRTFETPKNARPNPLRTIGELVELPISMAAAGWESVPALNPRQHPAGNYLAKAIEAYRKGGAAAVNAEYDPFGDASLRREGVDPAKVPGWVRGVGELGATWYSPTNVAIGKTADTALGLGGALTRAVRAASPRADAAARAVENAGSAAKRPVTEAIRRASESAGRTALGAARRAGYGVGSLVDRYQSAGLPQRGGNRFVTAAFAAQAAPAHAEAEAVNAFRKIGDGLTTAQKREMLKLSLRDEHGAPLYRRNPAIPEPKGVPAAKPRFLVRSQDGSTHAVIEHADEATARAQAENAASTLTAAGKPSSVERIVSANVHRRSLETRAQQMRDLQTGYDREQVELGLRKPEELYAPGLYHPMRQFGDEPVFRSHEMNDAARNGDAALLKAWQRRGGGGRYSASVPETGRRTIPTILDPEVEADLHPAFDPIYQAEQNYGRVARAIANERVRRGLESVPSIDPETGVQRTFTAPGFDTVPQTARMPVHYEYTPADGGPTRVFGIGEKGRAARDSYIERAAHGEAQSLARQDPEMQAYAQERGIRPSSLGTRGVIQRAIAPYRARAQEAGKAQAETGHTVTRLVNLASRGRDETRAELAGPFSRIAASLRGTGSDVGWHANALGEKLDANRAAESAARANARATSEAAMQARRNTFVLERLAKDPMTPAQRSIVDVARQLHGIEAEEFARVDPGPKSVTPDWVWDGRRWAMAGEFADVSPRYLDLSNKPTMPPVSTAGIVARVNGNADDVASQIPNFADAQKPGDELRAWMERHPAAPTIKGYLGDAERELTAQVRQAFSERRADKLEQMGLGHLSLDEALAQVQREAADLERSSQKYADEAAKRQFAERELGPTVRGAVEAGKRAQQRLGETEENVWDAGARAASLTDKALDRATAQGSLLDSKQIARVDRLTRDYKQRAAEAETAAKFALLSGDYYRKVFDEIAQTIRPKSAFAPEGYVKESELGLGGPSGREMALDKTFANFFKGQERLTPQEADDASKLVRAFEVLNRLARMSIVFMPQVHGINNLGMAYLAEGGEPGTMAAILAKRANFSEDLKQRAYTAGAATDWSQQAFQIGSGANATTAIPERAALATRKLGPLSRALQPAVAGGMYAGKAYNAMNRWLFHDVEQSYAFDLFDRFTKQGMSDGDAAIRVRNALGRYDNLSPRELAWNLNRVFFFYPWMKTVVPFWTKKGVLDPKWWSAPVRAIQANNEAQGYDDPSKPFTATLGRRADGEFRRVTIPVPQRVTENVAEAARIPYDIGAAALGKAPLTDALSDVAAPWNYVAGHLNPFLSVMSDLGEAAAGAAFHRGTPPFNAFHVDPSKTGAENERNIAGGILSRAIAPLQRVPTIIQDPAGGIPSYLTGAFDYAVKPQSQVVRERMVRATISSAYHDAIADAQHRGDAAEVQRLTALREAAIQRALAPPPRSVRSSSLQSLPLPQASSNPLLAP